MCDIYKRELEMFYWSDIVLLYILNTVNLNIYVYFILLSLYVYISLIRKLLSIYTFFYIFAAVLLFFISYVRYFIGISKYLPHEEISILYTAVLSPNIKNIESNIGPCT